MIKSPINIGDAQQERKLLLARILMAAGFVVFLSLILVARLAWLQIYKHDHFTTLSRGNRLKVVAIPPPRGLILSRDGRVIAENRPAFSLVADPSEIKPDAPYIAELNALLGAGEADRERFADQYQQRSRFDEVALIANMTEAQVAIFSAHRHNFPKFHISARSSRYYPDGELWAHVVGYVGRISEKELAEIDPRRYRATTYIGKSGVEASYEDVLHGDVGYQQVEINAQGRVVRVLEKTPPEPGNDLYLTVDAGLQREAQEALAGRRGAVVAINPETGGVLAMASTPSFDPNLFVNGIGRSDYAVLRDSPDRPLFNRALQGQYPPGSTIKPLVALAGLELGHRHADDVTSCPGWFRLPGDSHRYRDWLKRGHGRVDMLNAIAQSCDVYFYELARDIGIDDLHDFMARFGFGRVTGIDVPNEAAGLFPSSKWKRRARGVAWYPGETLIAGIGQGFTLATPLQLASAMATLAQRGFTLTPRLVGQVENPLTHTATEPQVLPRQAVPGVSDVHWDTVIGGMHEVLFGPRGTARGSARGAQYEYAGKTGTAQLFGIAQDETVKNEDIQERLRDHALFVAFAPLELPRIAVGIIVENGSSGSRTAAPIARRLFDYYLLPDSGEEALADDGTR